MTRRVVITGLGIIAPNGNGIRDFELALRKGQSGIRYQEIMEETKFACRVAGVPRGVDELAEAAFDEELLSNFSPGGRRDHLERHTGTHADRSERQVLGPDLRRPIPHRRCLSGNGHRSPLSTCC